MPVPTSTAIQVVLHKSLFWFCACGLGTFGQNSFVASSSEFESTFEFEFVDASFGFGSEFEFNENTN